MAQKSLFSLLSELPWWVSLAVAALVYSTGAMFSPLVAAAAAVPFVGVAGYIGWLRIRRGPPLDVPALLKALRSASPQEMHAMLAEAYARERYEISDGASGDLELRRNGYLTLVRFRRWRAQSTSPAAVKELLDAMRARKADHAIYVTAGAVTDAARRQAEAAGLGLIDGHGLAALVKQTRAARKALSRSEQETT